MVRLVRAFTFTTMLVIMCLAPQVAGATPLVQLDSGELDLNLREDLPGNDTDHNVIVTSTDNGTWTITEMGPGSLPPTGMNCTGNATTVTCLGAVTTRVYLDGGTQDDQLTLQTSGAAATIPATIMGHRGNDVLRGDGGADSIFGQDAGGDIGNEGDDILYGGCGGDDFAGGGGSDTVSYDDGEICHDDYLTITLDNLANDGRASEHDNVGGSATSVENIDGSNTSLADDTITGDSGPNVIAGFAGNDHLNGGAGNDTIDGGVDGDELTGGTGTDTLFGDAGGDNFHTVDGEVDSIDCGGDGSNGGQRDASDTVANCSSLSNTLSVAATYGPGSISVTGSVLTVDTNDTAAVDHRFILIASGNAMTISEITPTGPAVPAPVGPACVATATSQQVSCDVTGVTTVHVLSGAGNDTINAIQVGARTGVLVGERGDDRIFGGAGDDFLAGDAENGVDASGDGADQLSGGAGVDAYAGGGNRDLVSFADTTHSAGVTASLDGLHDDGPENEDIGGTTNSIEGLQGSTGPDVLTGNDADNQLYGNQGNDSLLGLGGVDLLSGDNGDDTIAARDGVADDVHCGTGSADLANVDVADAVDADCEGKDDGTKPATGGGGSNGGAVVVPPGGAVLGGIVFTSVTDTTVRKPFPEIRGLQYSAAQSSVNRAAMFELGPNVEWKPAATRYGSARSGGPLGTNPTKGPWQEGDVLSVTYRDGAKTFTVPGHLVTTGASAPVVATVTLYGGTTKDSCLQDGAQLAGLPWDDYQAAMASLHCKVDDVRVQTVKTTTAPREVDVDSGDRCEGGKQVAKAGNGRIDETIVAPESMALTDLRIYTMESAQKASLVAGTNALRATGSGGAAAQEAFQVFVGSRTGIHKVNGRWVGQFLNGAKVYVDATGVGGLTSVLTTGAGGASPGTATAVVSAAKPGRIRLAATWTDSTGQMVCGATHVDVLGPYINADPKKGDNFIDTEMGRRWTFTTTQAWKRTTIASKALVGSKAVPTGRAAAKGSWWDQVTGLLASFFGGGVRPATATVAATPVAVAAVDDASKDKIAHLNVGTAAGGVGPAAPIISTNGGGIVATGGGNIISGNGSALLSEHGLGIVATGGGNLTFGFDPDLGAVPTGVASIISGNGSAIISGNGSALIGPNGAGIISTNGGGITHVGGVALISEHGAGVVGAAGGNIISTGGGG
ncbi:MAG: hypothetical protein JWM98_1241 [Thermoleophilia bacterium]|nr:hypothetical protein [Thermoleophilia bacterium]